MSTTHECPKCNQPMDFQEWDPDVGIMNTYWFCTACDYSELAEYEDDLDLDRP